MPSYDDDRGPGFLSSLDEWVQSLPPIVHVILMIVGALAGWLYAFLTGASVKQSVFVGAFLVFFTLPLLILIVKFTLGAIIIGAFLALMYWVCFVKS